MAVQEYGRPGVEGTSSIMGVQGGRFIGKDRFREGLQWPRLEDRDLGQPG